MPPDPLRSATAFPPEILGPIPVSASPARRFPRERAPAYIAHTPPSVARQWQPLDGAELLLGLRPRRSERPRQLWLSPQPCDTALPRRPARASPHRLV